MSESSLSDRLISRRKAATKAAASFTEQLGSSSDSDSERSNKGKSRKYGKNSVKKSKQILGAKIHPETPSKSLNQEAIHPTPQSTLARPRSLSQRSRVSAPHSTTTRLGDAPTTSPFVLLKERTQPGCAVEWPEFPTTPKPPRPELWHLSPHSASKSHNITTPWDVSDLGTFVWVLIEEKGAHAFNLEDGANLNGRGIWWPGRITSPRLTDIPLNVKLFCFDNSIAIHKPSEHNVLSKLDALGRTRYHCPTFFPPIETLEPSPKKKRKYNIEQQWQDAVKEMLDNEAEDANSDDMPDIGEAFDFVNLFPSSSAPAAIPAPRESEPILPNEGKRKGKRKYVSDSEDGYWSPPPADYDLQIPGEPILARDGPNSLHYWPAKIMAYITPKNRKQKGKYHVLYLDKTEKDIPRSWFYTSDQDEFATCKLGVFESSHADVLNDDDEEVPEGSECIRSPSPVPEKPPPSPEDFADLDIRTQFSYTKPVLNAILNEKYHPARLKHDMFIKGGQGRKAVVDAAGLRGTMDPRSVADLQNYLSHWCLRDGLREYPDVEIVEDGEDGAVKPIKARNVLPECGTALHDVDDTLVERSSVVTNMDTFSPSSQGLPSDTTRSPNTSEVQSMGDNDEKLHCRGHITSPYQDRCAAYEALAGVEKVDYCLNVLLPEAILQILLWRAGERTSVELLSQEEEQALHDRGEVLIRETDFVFDVLRLRNSKLRQMERRTKKNESRPDVVSRSPNSSSRPRRSIGVLNYQE